MIDTNTNESIATKKARNSYKSRVENGTVSPEYSHNYKRGIYKELAYESSYELIFLKSLDKLVGGLENISVTRCPPVEYEYEGKLCTYYPDYLINEIPVEVKSSYTMKKELGRNLAKISSLLNSYERVLLVINHKWYYL